MYFEEKEDVGGGGGSNGILEAGEEDVMAVSVDACMASSFPSNCTVEGQC